MRTSYKQVKGPCSRILGFCEADPRVMAFVNEAQARLLPMGKWANTYQHYRFCPTSPCITLPRQFETIEVAAIGGFPQSIRNEWFPYVQGGLGLTGSQVVDVQDKGFGWVAFNDVIGDNKKLRVYSDAPEAAGAKILLQFWNENGLPVRTLDGLNWIDGEKVAISQVQTNTVNFCRANGFVGVQKPITNGTVFIYEYDTVTLAQRLLATYEPTETEPDYRRYVIPFCGDSVTGSCSSQIVDIVAKLRFIPVAYDDDWLIIGNVGALKLAVKAIKLEENNMVGEAAMYWYGGTLSQGGQVSQLRGARGILEDELSQFLGEGAQTVIQIYNEAQGQDVGMML